MVIVFDLDDTLYEETSYVKSGFNTVAKFLERKYKLNSENVYKTLIKEFEVSRNSVFDRTLDKYHLLTKRLVHECLMVYRKHKPKIKLYPEALEFLKKHKNLPLYVVTDGNCIVQRNKIKALGLEKLVKKTFLTWKKGREFSKPSPFYFNLIVKREKVKPEEVLCIGDDPGKDFVGIKSQGFKTVRILRGRFSSIPAGIDYNAEWELTSFKQIDELQLLVNSK